MSRVGNTLGGAVQVGVSMGGAPVAVGEKVVLAEEMAVRDVVQLEVW